MSLGAVVAPPLLWIRHCVMCIERRKEVQLVLVQHINYTFECSHHHRRGRYVLATVCFNHSPRTFDKKCHHRNNPK